jgi:hypothetical protein
VRGRRAGEALCRRKHDLDTTASAATALFVSSLQPSGHPTPGHGARADAPGAAALAEQIPRPVTAPRETPGIDAAMQLGGSISGRVAAAGGGPLSGICVSVFAPETDAPVSGSATDFDGTYTVAGITAGSYGIEFTSGCGSPDVYAAQWYDNQPSQAAVDPVTVTAGADTGSINAAMAAGGSISGRVTAAVGGSGLAGICVDVFTLAGALVAGTGTGMMGDYTVGLAGGTYYIEFTSDCGSPDVYAVEWYDNQPSQAQADPVVVTVGQTTQLVDAVLALPTAPGPPTGVTGTAGNGQVSLSWTAPANNGGSPITGYVVTPYVSGTAQSARTFNSTAITQTITGLINGTAYTFKVAARNAVGAGPQSSQSAAVTPRTVPGAPTGVTGTAGNGQVGLSWTAPASNGGSPITGYVVTPYVNGTAQSARTFDSTATTQTITGLTNGTAYTFRVAALNAAGAGPQSSQSAAVTPAAPAIVAFTSATRTVSETAGTVQLAVTRAGNAAVPATVHYAVTGGTATRGSDFKLADGTVSFAAGALTRTVPLGIVNDVLRETAETIVVKLSSPGAGTELGTPTSMTVTIQRSAARLTA